MPFLFTTTVPMASERASGGGWVGGREVADFSVPDSFLTSSSFFTLAC